MDENLDLSKNIEINEALKEFEATSAPVQGNRIESSAGVKEDTEQPKIIGFVMKISGGLIKDQKQAEYVLIGFVFIAILFSIFLFLNANSKNRAEIKAPSGYHIIYPTDAPPKMEKIL